MKLKRVHCRKEFPLSTGYFKERIPYNIIAVSAYKSSSENIELPGPPVILWVFLP